jgi:hypothetical protein
MLSRRMLDQVFDVHCQHATTQSHHALQSDPKACRPMRTILALQ